MWRSCPSSRGARSLSGRGVNAIKNGSIRFFVSLHGALLRRRRPPPPAPRLLVISTTGLGDTLWGLPALRYLRSLLPDAYIAAVTSPIGHELLATCRALDELFLLKRSTLASWGALYATLRARQIDGALLFHASQRWALPFCHLVGARQIAGTEGLQKGLDALLTHPQPRLQEHEAMRRLRLVGGLVGKAETLSPALLQEFPIAVEVTKEDRAKAQTWIEQWGPLDQGVPWIGLHPGAKDRFKQWPARHFVALGERLRATLPCQLLVSGSSAERALVEEVAAALPGAIPVAGTLPLRPLAALLQRLALFISNDTGPMHLASAMGTPTLGLFGPTDPALCSALGPGPFRAIAVPPTCTPCLRKSCRDPFCLRQIGVEEVCAAALALARSQPI